MGNTRLNSSGKLGSSKGVGKMHYKEENGKKRKRKITQVGTIAADEGDGASTVKICFLWLKKNEQLKTKIRSDMTRNVGGF